MEPTDDRPLMMAGKGGSKTLGSKAIFFHVQTNSKRTFLSISQENERVLKNTKRKSFPRGAVFTEIFFAYIDRALTSTITRGSTLIIPHTTVS